MTVRRPLKILFYCNVLIVCLLLGYKVYPSIVLSGFAANTPAQIEAVQARLENRDRSSFAVVGKESYATVMYPARRSMALRESAHGYSRPSRCRRRSTQWR
jgi:hypothetical protein